MTTSNAPENSLLNQTPTEGDPNASAQPSIWDGQKVNWPEGFEDDLKEAKILKGYVNDEGDFDLAKMMKSYVNLDKMRGNMIKMPSDLDTPEDKARFMEKVLGFNSDPESYKLDALEESVLTQEFQSELKEFLFEQKIPLDSAKELRGFIEKKYSEMVTAETEGQKAKVAETLQNLQTKWGDGYEKMVTYAQEVVKNFGGDDMLAYMDQTGIGNDQRVIEFLAGLGQKLYTEQQLTQGKEGFSNFGMTPFEAEAKISELTSDMNGPYWNSSHPNHSKAVQQVTKYREIVAKGRQKTTSQHGFA